MKKKLKYGSLVLASLVLVTGCGTIPTLEDGKEAVVTFENDDKISVDDLYNEVKANYALEQLITMVDTHIFETEFKDEIEDAKASAEANIEGMIASYGSEEDLLAAIQSSTNFSTIEAYQDYLYISNLQSHAIEQYAKDQITDDQIEKYYDEEAKGDVEVSHILISPAVSSTATDDEISEAETAAKAEINEIIDLLDAASKDGKDIEEEFATLAEERSDDTSTTEDGGDLGKINYGDLDENYDELIDAAHALKDGDYSTEVITTELGYHIILKTKSHEKESLEDLEDEIRTILSENLLSTEATLTLDALEYYRETYGVEIVDSELKEQYETFIKELRQQYTTTAE